MSRLATSFVLGYHGCDEKIGRKILSGKASLAPSEKDFDWLGPGIYFWESDPRRALEWAQARVESNKITKPFVLGAIIDLGYCLDLSSREDLELLKLAHSALQTMLKADGLELPKNRNIPHSGDQDRRLRNLDCAVIKHLHTMIADGQLGVLPAGYDTIRGLFLEGTDISLAAASKAKPMCKSPFEMTVASKVILFHGPIQPFDLLSAGPAKNTNPFRQTKRPEAKSFRAFCRPTRFSAARKLRAA